jgi:signal transduction histidine kinase/ligand-binding sensor domain-containing protein
LLLRNLSTYREDVSRRQCLFRWAAAGLAALCLAVSASGADPTRTISQYLHDSWGINDGFPEGTVTAIAQTSDGYLWIGTKKGLVRFDGFSFHHFAQANPDPILIGPVRSLLVDAGDNLWILLENTQLFRYRNGSFELIRGEVENGTTAIARGNAGSVLLSSILVGTLTYSANQLRTLSPTLLADAGGAADGGTSDQRSPLRGWSPVMMPDRQPPLTLLVLSMAQTDDGKIWLGTERRGLFYFEKGRTSSASGGHDDTKINCLLPLQSSELWVGTSKGVLRWNGTELTLAGVPPSFRNLEVFSIVRDRDSNIWVGTSRGLFRYNANGVSLLSPHEATGAVTALFEDREGNIWFGGTRRLERLRDSAFVTYSLPNLKSQGMGPLLVDSSGRTWVAPIQGGLRWLKGEKSGVVTADGLAEDVVYSIAGAGKDDIWVGRQQGGLTHLQYSGDSFTAKTYTEADGLAQNRVYAVYQSRDGTIWSGTLNSGVSELKNGHFTNYTTTSGLAANTISSIAEGVDGTMWFGTPKGVSVMSQKGWRTYTRRDGLPSEDVNCLLQDSSRILWLGTAEGLAYMNDGQVHVPRGVPESLRAPIVGIEEDKNGGLWIATSDHVLSVPRDKLLSGVLQAVDVREYDQADGLESTEGVKRSRSVVSDSSARIWFSLGSGLSVVDPSRVNDNSVPALPHIEAITADNNTVNLAASVQIPPSPRRVAFEYTGLSLAEPGRIRFRYFLEGFDSGWSQPVAAREAVYTNLGPRSYRFRLIASSREGQWNGPETAIVLNVAPAYYQTYWFRLSCAAVFVALLWAGYQMRVHQLRRQFNMILEERVGERTRIARELHDTLLQSFHGLLMRFQAVSNELDEGEPKQERDDTIDRAARAITEGRDAVQGLRSSIVESNDLAEALANLGKELTADDSRSPEFTMQVEGAQERLHPLLRDEVYRTAGEALRNAFRHANARRIEVEIRYDERQFRLRVRDDGKGMDPTLLVGNGRAGHFGLRGMRERAERAGGTLTVWSELESGTEVELSIPAAHAYTKVRAPRRRWWLAEKILGKDHKVKP